MVYDLFFFYIKDLCLQHRDSFPLIGRKMLHLPIKKISDKKFTCSIVFVPLICTEMHLNANRTRLDDADSPIMAVNDLST